MNLMQLFNRAERSDGGNIKLPYEILESKMGTQASGAEWDEDYYQRLLKSHERNKKEGVV